uniref:Uncharacterized protein n=1 Tax=Oryza punctata TaxID=4537 RepID=A0A0E0K3W9_ORYPU
MTRRGGAAGGAAVDSGARGSPTGPTARRGVGAPRPTAVRGLPVGADGVARRGGAGMRSGATELGRGAAAWTGLRRFFPPTTQSGDEEQCVEQRRRDATAWSALPISSDAFHRATAVSTAISLVAAAAAAPRRHSRGPSPRRAHRVCRLAATAQLPYGLVRLVCKRPVYQPFPRPLREAHHEGEKSQLKSAFGSAREGSPEGVIVWG